MRALTSITFIASLAVTPALSLAQTQPAQPAQPAQPQTASGRAEEAQEHIAAAMAAFRAQRFSTAIREFEASYRAAPDADVWYNLARAREMSGDLAGAIADYQRYLRDKVDPPDREEVLRTIRGLQTRIDTQAAASRQTVDGAQMRLVLEGAPHGSRFYLDGVELPANQDPRHVALGDHAVRVTADASQEWAARVRVRAGETAAVFAAPATATRYVTRPRSHVVSIALAGAGAVSLGVAAYFGVRATAEGCDACNEQVTASNRSDIFLGVGTGFLVGAAVAYFIERATSGTERVASP